MVGKMDLPKKSGGWASCRANRLENATPLLIYRVGLSIFLIDWARLIRFEYLGHYIIDAKVKVSQSKFQIFCDRCLFFNFNIFNFDFSCLPSSFFVQFKCDKASNAVLFVAKKYCDYKSSFPLKTIYFLLK